MNYSSFVFENNDGIATVRLNDPEKLNALTFQTYGDLEKIMAELADDKSVKVVVLTGTGKVSFRRQRQRHHQPPLDERRRALHAHAHDLQRGEK
jgi:1,4-dihydroxy-2-naphthoyl-CoA synthase